MKLGRTALAKFNKNLSLLKKFKSRHGHFNISGSPRYNELVLWIENIQTMEKVLPLKQVRQLKEIDFEFRDEKEIWSIMIKKLKAYSKTYGHCYIHSEEEALFNWTENIKQIRSILKKEQIRELDVLGFNWQPLSSLEALWEYRFQELRAFKIKHEHCLVPENFPENPTLAHWVSHQRKIRLKRAGRRVISPEKKKKLDEIGFVWEVDGGIKTQRRWESFYEEVLKFYKKHKHLTIPQNYKGARTLNIWLIRQRGLSGSLPQKRKEKLKAIGFLFKEEFEEKKRHLWDERYEELRRFKKEHGSWRVPRSEKLGKWLDKQRTKREKLTSEQRKKLQMLGVKFYNVRSFDRDWKAMFKELLKFKKKNGHPNVPAEYSINQSLATWANNIRRFKKKLSVSKVRMLDEIGFDFKGYRIWKQDKSWEKNFKELIKFKNIFGHCNVTETYKEYKSLAYWVVRQRVNKSKLSKEKRKLLSDIGFEWNKKRW